VIRSLGVVVPAHNEQDRLPACLASLHPAARALRGSVVHLVVVADRCRDHTAKVARCGGAAVVTIDAQRAGAARAAGVREVLRRTSHLL
jgi:glycosyltransferase involved in cell wall biosynthesis